MNGLAEAVAVSAAPASAARANERRAEKRDMNDPLCSGHMSPPFLKRFKNGAEKLTQMVADRPAKRRYGRPIETRPGVGGGWRRGESSAIPGRCGPDAKKRIWRAEIQRSASNPAEIGYRLGSGGGVLALKLGRSEWRAK